MAIQLQLRRGDLTENDSFTGQPGEVSVDLTKNTLRVHDGTTVGGHELAKATLSNVAITKSLTPLLSGEIDVGTPGNQWRDIYLSRSVRLAGNVISSTERGIQITTPSGNFIGIDQSLTTESSPTFENLMVNGAIYADFTSFKRRSLTKELGDIIAFSSMDFDLNIGKSVLAFKVAVSAPCLLEVFDSEARDQSNPYTFMSTADHLEDDGSTILSDGSILRGRRYYIWSSKDNINTIYCRVTNLENRRISNFTLSIEYIPFEISMIL